MPAPVVHAAGVTLKKTGNSNYWLFATDAAVTDAVKLYKQGTMDLLWEGTIVQAHPSKPKKMRAQLHYVGTLKEVTDPDTIDVDVTITNATGESPRIGDVVIVDGP